jgi:L-gulono-1,4-lactone dehydrogenase
VYLGCVRDGVAQLERRAALPARIERPRDRADLIEAVRRATDQALTVRAVGSGHSFTDAA